MENLKHTKKYAEKLSQELWQGKNIGNTKHMRMIFVYGYMKAIEETAAPELLEALIEARKHMTAHIPERIFDLTDNALNKATK